MQNLRGCNACHHELENGVDFGPHPIANQLLTSQHDEVSLFRLGVSVCRNCGLVQLAKPLDPSMFYENYSTPSAWKAEAHCGTLLNELTRIVPKDSKVLDVGCNDGVFLDLLRDSGWTHTSGLEPTANTAEVCRAKGFSVVQEKLTSTLANELVMREGTWDCVILRQVLEHIVELEDFGRALATLVKPDGVLVVEVPDARVNLHGFDYGVWEEHANYFTPNVLEDFLRNCGFKVEMSYESLFSGVCLTVIARRLECQPYATRYEVQDEQLVKEITANFDLWVSEFSTMRSNIQNFLQEVSENGPLILYGVGCRSTNFTNIMGVGDYLTVAVDSQPAKQGKFVPGARLKIVSPDHYSKIQGAPATVLLGVNAENENRVIESSIFPVAAWYSILPPSPRLLPIWPVRES